MMFKYMCLVLFITWYQLADCHPAKSDVKSLDSMIDKESEAFLAVEAEESSQKTVRDKRTIGFLRQLFPNFSQIVDRKIQQITRFLFRVIGRLVLRGGGGGAGAAGGTTNGGGSESGNSGGRRVSITLPTFPPSTDDEDDDQSTEAPATVTPEAVESRAADVVNTTPVSPAAAADSVAAASSADSVAEIVAVTTQAPAAIADATTTTTVNTTNAGKTNAEAAAVTTNSPTTQRPSDADNTVVVKRTAREASTEDTNSAQKRSPLTDTENNEVSSDNALQNTDDSQVENEEDPRNKRFLLNLRGGGGGGGGSGNFLFDLIRLVAGSGANQDRDESVDAAPLETEAQEVRADLNGKEDGYSVGVPGPLTRIFVIANRGVANLVQDLILRLAQTTERIVNFKARLITSLI